MGRQLATEKEFSMSDDKSKTRPQDAQRVNVNEDYEVRYWCEKFGCSPEQLRKAVEEAGVMVADVEKKLGSGGAAAGRDAGSGGSGGGGSSGGRSAGRGGGSRGGKGRSK
jgi:hypothetical protein